MITILDDASIRSKYPFEADNMGERFATENGIYTFSSPGLEVLQKNYIYLLANSEVRQLEKRFYYKPSYLSFAVYGVPNLDYLLMYINNIMCAEDFTMDNVYVPSMDSIVAVCGQGYRPKSPDKLETIQW
jgi:hypothetical protein